MMKPRSPVTRLSRRRIWLAFAVAIVTDLLQISLGPLGWTFVDEVLDILAAIVQMVLLGFHPLLLPTFILELIPVIDMFPTWTGCVWVVVLLRRKKLREQARPPENMPPVIDV